jgi:hypothetical protein
MSSVERPRYRRVRRLVALLDPADPGFMGRVRRAVGAGMVVLLLLGCAVAYRASRIPIVRFLAGGLLVEAHLFGPAEWVGRGLVEDHPTERVAYYEVLSEVYRRTDRDAELLALWDDVARRLPDDWEAAGRRCWSYARVGSPSDAMPFCDRAVGLAPEDEGRAHVWRGWARSLLDDIEGGRADLTEALSRFERNPATPGRYRAYAQRDLAAIEEGRNPMARHGGRVEAPEDGG